MTPEEVIANSDSVTRDYYQHIVAYKTGGMRNAAFRGIAESIATDPAWSYAQKGERLTALCLAGRAADSHWSGRPL